MNVLVYADAHLYKTKDGKIWAKTVYGYEFWKRYLNTFESIIVMTRVQCVDAENVEGYLESSGPKVSFIELPMVLGSENKLRYIIEFPKIVKIVQNSIKSMDCGIFRVPAVMGYIVLHYFMKTGKPFSMELVSDPFLIVGNKIERKLMGEYLKRIVRKANGVSYVTQYYLQNILPSYAGMHGENERYFESYYSSIDLKEEYFSTPRDYIRHDGSFRIIHISTHMNNDRKGHKVVIDVTRRLKELGYDIQTFLIGDGTKRKEFEEYANLRGLSDVINFVGILSSKEEIRDWLLNSDLFLFPSTAEGVPRSIIEAMAVGLPCISTPIGGIPELLSREYLVEPGDIEGFVNKIAHLLDNRRKLNEMSIENIERARHYESSILQARRDNFYSKLKDLAQKC